ncbi:MAG: A/G-specific adenine glycosylase [Candidatus Diapherotrites archaeon]|nr:A/G-specific adenine glycosylase [Candidatus Diapherotrites archaeon]
MPNPFPTRKLLRWFATHQRPLPWRKTYNPYQVWVSEVMAQQTQIKQMLPFYERFMKRFPSLRALADADSQDVLKAWEGLGYYSRARNLHAAARTVMKEKKGVFPTSKNDLLQLQGCGPYIASAVASIAFREDVPVVDGNVLRVMSRVWGDTRDVTLSQTKIHFERKLIEILPHGQARAFNQALMEVGALICTPEKPACGACPLHSGCTAYANGTQNRFPVKSKKKKPVSRIFAGVVIREKDQFLLIQRHEALLKGLWEFPTIPYAPLTQSISDIEENFLANGFPVILSDRLGTVKHVYSHFTQHVHVFSGRPIGKAIQGHWVPVAHLEKKPFSGVQQKMFNLIFSPVANSETSASQQRSTAR